VAISVDSHRPRNVDWKRAAALLYGDWGTSKAYVIGLAFAAAGFSSFPLIIAVCLLTGLVGVNYMVVCRYFPDGGGVYSAARSQGRALAVLGALLLVADLTVTAALSGWEAFRYLRVPQHLIPYATIGLVVALGVLNSFGPRHSGSLAMALAVPMVVVVVGIIALAVPHLTLTQLEAPHANFKDTWVAFTGVILALSGVEAIANLTGVIKLDPGSTPSEPRVGRESFKAILPVGIEVTLGTLLLGWAMLSLPKSMDAAIHKRHEDVISFLAEHYGGLTIAPWFGQIFGWVVGIVVCLLLISAVNTAIAALIGILYMLARDGEMPKPFLPLNRHGVPKLPLLVSVLLPSVVLLFTIPSPEGALHMLAGLYAIGVVGAISVNLGSCTFNKKLPLKWHERGLFAVTFFILAAVELTLARTKPDALFFVACVLGVGFAMRAWSHKVSGLETVTLSKEMADLVRPEALEMLRPQLCEGQRLLVAAQGLTPVMSYALDETQLRKGTLYVLYVKKEAVMFSGPVGSGKKARWEDDPRASAILSVMLKQGQDRGITVIPLYATAEDVASVILDFSATLGVDYLIMGASQRRYLTGLLTGNVISNVAASLPESIKLVIYS
jgi:amino acid transporter/nucleotide-binding universal stress UspA family protein